MTVMVIAGGNQMRRLVLCFMLVVLAACNSLDEGTIAPTQTPTAAQTPITRATATPGLTLVPHLPDQPIPEPTRACVFPAPITRMILDERGQVMDDDMRPLNVRSGPSTEYRILGRLEVLEVFLVLDGPVCGGDYAWYRVQHDDLIGWVAEGDLNQYYIEPYFPG